MGYQETIDEKIDRWKGAFGTDLSGVRALEKTIHREIMPKMQDKLNDMQDMMSYMERGIRMAKWIIEASEDERNGS